MQAVPDWEILLIYVYLFVFPVKSNHLLSIEGTVLVRVCGRSEV